MNKSIKEMPNFVIADNKVKSVEVRNINTFLPRNTRGLNMKLYNGDKITERGELINRNLVLCGFLTGVAINQAMKIYSMVTSSTSEEGRRKYSLKYNYYTYEAKRWTKKLYEAIQSYEKDFAKKVDAEEQTFLCDCFDYGDDHANLVMMKLYNSIFIEVGKAGFEDQKIISTLSMLLYMSAFAKTLFESVSERYIEIKTQMKWMGDDINMFFQTAFSFARSLKKRKRDGTTYNGTLFEVTNKETVNLGLDSFKTILYDDKFFYKMYMAGEGITIDDTENEVVEEEKKKQEVSMSEALEKLKSKGWKIA